MKGFILNHNFKLKTISFVALLGLMALSGCVPRNGSVSTTSINRTGDLPTSQSCLNNRGESITCTTKRIQIKLYTLESQIDNIVGAIGDCDSCGI